MNEIVICIISSMFSFLGVVITVIASNAQTRKKMQEQSELTVYRIQQLEKKQDKHNTLIERMYKVEDRIDVIDEKLTHLD